MIRSSLRYHRPSSLRAVSELLAEHAGNVAVLGGGTMLLPKMNRDEIHVDHVVDLVDLGLDGISVEDGWVEIGARATYADVLNAPGLADVSPLLPRFARGVTGGRQLVQQATLVGAACLNFPGSEIPAVLVALDARIRIHGPEGERELSASSFFVGALATGLARGEFVVSVRVAQARRAGYCKIKHSAGSWPIVTACVLEHPVNRTLCATLGVVQAVPIQIEFEDVRELAARVDQAITAPWSDELASGSYRAAIASVAARRAFMEFEEWKS